MKKIMTALFPMICVIMNFMMILPVHAKEDSIRIQIPVEITLEGTEPATPETYEIIIQADQDTYPLPKETHYRVEGASSFSLDAITFDHVGIYTYTVQQIQGNNADCIYDDTVYRITVTVTNSESGGLETTVVVTPNEGNEKQSAIKFHNIYKTAVPAETPASQKGYVNTGDTSSMGMYAAMIIVSFATMFILYFAKKKLSEEE